MKIQSKDISKYIQDNTWATIKELVHFFNVTSMTIHRHMKILLSQSIIIKKWKTPYVKYYIKEKETPSIHIFSPNDKRLLQHEWYQISKTWEELLWVKWFITRCETRKQSPEKAFQRWKKSIFYIDSITTPYGIIATKKLENYEWSTLEELIYGHIYALPEFGKTTYGTWMEIAKTYPSTDIFSQLIDAIQQPLKQLIKEKNIDALCFARPTANRSLQIMDYLEKTLFPEIPRIKVQKKPWYFPPQKTLKKREDRIVNAKTSFEVIKNQQKYAHVLIIDDAVWSGATLVEIWNKIREAGFAEKVTGFSIIWTANGIFEEIKSFEVLANV